MKGPKLFLIFLISIILISSILAEDITLNVGESQEISGNTIKLKSLKSDKAVITVNTDSKIIEQGDEETIGPLKVRLVEISYFGPSEGNVKLDVTSLYSCGDNKCEGPETKESCCQDCGCQPGYDCINKECLVHVEHECDKDEECDDNNPSTSDRCVGYPRKCVNANIEICNEDLDCNDNRECTTDVCRNNDCFNEPIEGCESEEPEIPEQQGNTNQEQIEDFQENLQNLEDKQFSFWGKIINFFKKIFGSE